MAGNIRQEVYRRLVLAKSLHRAGDAACASRNDQMNFTKGILLLHDAAEAGLGAIADHLNARLTGNHYLLDYYDLIENADPQGRKVPYRTQMRNLNTLRNNAKHQGILPDPKGNAHFPATVHALLDDICQTYLALDFSSVSLKSLINNRKVLQSIEEAESELKVGNIEKALISLAYAMYHICEAISLLVVLLDEKPIHFPDIHSIPQTIKLIQHGVDPYLYYRFKNMTPQVGRRGDTSELVHRWDKNLGHPGNWTRHNATFCLSFCIDAALKFRREEDESYPLIPYQDVYEDIIEAINDEVIIWDRSFYAPIRLIVQPTKTRSPVLTLRKGQSIIGFANDSEDRPDEWYITSKNIPHIPSEFAGFGFVSKSDVKITRREKDANENNDS